VELTKKDIKNEEELQLLFLRETREGKYAPIEESSLPYARMGDIEDIVTFIEEEDYYYSIS
jgi:hypothetical protein